MFSRFYGGAEYAAGLTLLSANRAEYFSRSPIRFEPQLLAKLQCRLPGFGDYVVSMGVGGMSTPRGRDDASHHPQQRATGSSASAYFLTSEHLESASLVNACSPGMVETIFR